MVGTTFFNGFRISFTSYGHIHRLTPPTVILSLKSRQSRYVRPSADGTFNHFQPYGCCCDSTPRWGESMEKQSNQLYRHCKPKMRLELELVACEKLPTSGRPFAWMFRGTLTMLVTIQARWRNVTGLKLTRCRRNIWMMKLKASAYRWGLIVSLAQLFAILEPFSAAAFSERRLVVYSR